MLGNWGLALPTEAQWECAARGGTATAYWWGDRWEGGAGAENFQDVSWQLGHGMAGDAALGNDRYPLFAPVDSLRPNPFGLHHVLGDVAEWCSDWFEYYDFGDAQHGAGERSKNLAISGRVLRGGSSRDGAAALRCAARSHELPDAVSGFVGVRPARAISTESTSVVHNR